MGLKLNPFTGQFDIVGSGGGGGGVSDINGLSGSITLTDGPGITITPVGNNLTISITIGDPNTLAYFDGVGNLSDNISAKFDELLNAMAFGIETAGGAINSAANGSLTHGFADTAGAINANGNGATAQGFSSNGANLSADGTGAQASGYVDLGVIIASGPGSHAHGEVTDDSQLRAPGIGSTAQGQVATEGKIIADGSGSVARGSADNNGEIYTSLSGSSAEGTVDGLGSLIRTDSIGSKAFGSASGAAVIECQGIGTLAHGSATNADSTIRAEGLGSHAHGSVDTSGVIRSNGIGAHASGSAESSGELSASGLGAMAHGLCDNFATLRAIGTGSYAAGHANGGQNLDATGAASYACGVTSEGTIFASGTSSFAHGDFLNVSGNFATSFGHGNNAVSSFGCLVNGRYANAGGTPTSWIATEPLFVLGNGTSTAAKANAFQVDKDGRMIDTASHVRTAVRVATGAAITVDARTDYKILVDTTDAAAGVINLPAGEGGLTYRIAGVGGGAFTYTVTPDGLDVMDASAATLISSSDVAEYTFLGGIWYQS